MKISAAPVVVFALAVLIFSHSASAQAPVAEYAGIQAIVQSYGDKNDALRPFQAFDDGVKVAFLVKQAAGGIIGVDTSQGTIETFADDKGTKLQSEGGFKDGFGSFPGVSKDGKAAMFTVEGTKAPAAGATSVTVKGKVTVNVATKKETVKGGAVAKAAKLTFKTLTLDVKTLEKSGSETRVEVNSSQKMDAIVEANWLDAAGKKLEAEDGGRGSSGFGGKMTWSRDWTVKGTPASVEFTGWTDMKSVSVPFAATIAIGATK